MNLGYFLVMLSKLQEKSLKLLLILKESKLDSEDETELGILFKRRKLEFYIELFWNIDD